MMNHLMNSIIQGEWIDDFFFVHITDTQLGFNDEYEKRDDSTGTATRGHQSDRFF